MALANASGLGRPSVARLGAADPPHRRFRLSTADASARARAPPTERPRLAPPRTRPRAPPFRTRRARAGNRRNTRARAAAAGARRGLTRARGRSRPSRIVPVASDALPDRRTHRLAPDTRRDPASFTDACRKKTGGAAGGLRGRLVPGEHREPRAPPGKHGGRRALEDALFAAGGSKPPTTKPRVGASEVEPQLENGQRRLLAGDRGVPPFGARPGGVGRGPGEGTTRRRRSARRSTRIFLRRFACSASTRRRRASRRGARACVGRTTTCSPRGAWGYRGYRPRGPRGQRLRGWGIPGDVPWPGAPRAAAQSPAETLALFRDALSKFEGSHYFHNYTRGARRTPVAKTRTVTEKDAGAVAETYPRPSFRRGLGRARLRDGRGANGRGARTRRRRRRYQNRSRVTSVRAATACTGFSSATRTIWWGSSTTGASFRSWRVTWRRSRLTLNLESRVSPSCASRCAATRSCCTRFARWSPPPSPSRSGTTPGADPREPHAAGAGRDSDRAAFDALPARRGVRAVREE